MSNSIVMFMSFLIGEPRVTCLMLLFIYRNGDGFLDREEFGDILHLTGEPVTEEDIDEMFGDSDTNKDGKIDFDGKITTVNSTVSSVWGVHEQHFQWLSLIRPKASQYFLTV